MAGLSDIQKTVLEELKQKPQSRDALADNASTTPDYAWETVKNLRNAGFTIQYNRSDNKYYLDSDVAGYEVDHITIELLIDELQDEGATYRYLEEEYGASQGKVENMISTLDERGYTIEHRILDSDGTRLFFIPDERGKTYIAGDGDGTYKFALMSDTHLGSTAEHLNELHDFYDRIEEAGIDTVYHTGDVTDGYKVHKGHVNVLKGEAIGWGRLRDYTTENYPSRDGIDTYFIEGNHDNKFYKRNGIHLGQQIANRREDMHYMGDSMAEFVFDQENDITMELIHPAGGKPYTPGYRLMTLYRERPASERPSIAGVGHMHGSMYVKAEGVRGFYTGCWKGLTTWGKKKGHNSVIGGWIIELTIENGEIRRLQQEFIEYEADNTTNQWNVRDLG